MEKAKMKLTKVLHINARGDVTYMLLRDGLTIKSNLSSESAVKMLQFKVFDLIFSEPHDLAGWTSGTWLKEDISRYSNQWIRNLIASLGASTN